jgi:hypothetical protein
LKLLSRKSISTKEVIPPHSAVILKVAAGLLPYSLRHYDNCGLRYNISLQDEFD